MSNGDIDEGMNVRTGSEGRRTRRLGTAILAIGLLTLAACGSSGSSSETTQNAPESSTNAPGGDVVEMRLIAYRPAELDVSTGTTVTWKQRDAGFHTVTSGTVTKGATAKTDPDGTFDSGRIAKGEEFTHTFAEAGTFTYFCEIHPATMNGQVTVR
jgi:plastocyanin